MFGVKFIAPPHSLTGEGKCSDVVVVVQELDLISRVIREKKGVRECLVG